MNHEVKKIIIAGGGIGGLSAAISLGRAGFEVTLCEAASGMRKKAERAFSSLKMRCGCCEKSVCMMNAANTAFKRNG